MATSDNTGQGTFEMFEEAIQEEFNQDVFIEGLGDIAESLGLKSIDLDIFDQVSADTILKGIEVEFEHTEDASIALIIALHHLGETLEYYEIHEDAGL